MQETIPGRFFRQAAVFGRKPLFLSKRAGSYHPMSWQQAAEDVRALSAWLLSTHVNPGERIILLAENRPEWGIADLAIQSIGAWTVPIYPSLTAQDLRVICQDCEPVMGVVSTIDQLRKLLDIRADVPSLRLCVVMDDASHLSSNCLLWAEALRQGREAGTRFADFLEHRLAQVNPHDTSTIIYTSGTTGEPKGVLLSHQNFLSNADACRQVIPITDTDLHLSFLPLSHVFERMAGWYLMLSAGASVAYAESMDTIPQNMLEVRPTVMLGVPRFFEKLYARLQEAVRTAPPLKRQLATWAFAVGRAVTTARSSGQRVPVSLALKRWIAERLVCHRLKERLGGRLRFFVSGSAPLAKEIGEFFYSVGLTILEGYGLTESSPVIAVNRLPLPRFGSVGQTVPGVEVWIADDGEILTRGPHVMQGYYRKPEATAATVTDGWLHTGDIGHLDHEGYLFITDRKKDLIKTAGGKFVAPQKLENLFVMDPYISQAFVYGERRPYCVALLVPNFEQLRRYAQEQSIAAASAEELVRDPRVQAFYWSRVEAKQQSLASFEQIKKVALLDREFSQAAGELTPTLKAKRRTIAERYEAVLRRLYEAPG